ncbi:secreted RxLR effector protein 161-like [Pistacia vera]|uniref:secreted RxLR effector protein 161-like n=1 Tax=Pistacia vera TaxID=55513 RepID=UPI0012636E13|nr:secreted RxLR effector protein 161-like [Pistacia vera]
MEMEFDMTDLGEMSNFLGMEIYQSLKGIFVCQKKYANEVLMKFNMDNCKSVDILLIPSQKLSKEDGAKRVDEGVYRSLIGCLLYLIATKPDLMYTTSLVSRFMSKPSEMHYKAAKRVLWYIKGTTVLGIWSRRAEKFSLIGYSDSDWAGSADDMRSTSGYVFFVNHGAFSWLSKNQDTIAQSTAEAEYISATAATNQTV